MNLLTAASVAACHDAQMTTSSSPETAAPATGRAFGTIGVIGLGTMGAGIAEVFARNGFSVVGVEQNEEALLRGRQHLEHSTNRAVKRGKLTEDEQNQIFERITFTTELKDVADCQMVVEAIVEHLDL